MATSSSSNQKNKRIHPHKFTLWVAMGSICMMFAGLTSAYIVKRNQSNFLEFSLPNIFWISTIVIIVSSITIQLALHNFKAKYMSRYRVLITITATLGFIFAILQVMGFINLENHGIKLTGTGSNPAASFILVIAGLHMLHVLGGVVALLYLVIKTFATRVRTYNATPVEIITTYWHFVDILWIYLLIFLLWFR